MGALEGSSFYLSVSSFTSFALRDQSELIAGLKKDYEVLHVPWRSTCDAIRDLIDGQDSAVLLSQ